VVARSFERMLERDAELAELDAALARTAAGEGALVVVEGPGGIGKSRLLAAARERAAGSGMRVLAARASELERSFSFGVVRQLLEPVILRAPEEERCEWFAGAARLAAVVLELDERRGEPRGEEDIFPLLHGLYWLCANLAAVRPLLLAVDDVRWADEASVAFLGFLGRRLDGLRIVLMVATGPVDPGSDPLAAQLLSDAAAIHLWPRELSVPATAELVRGWLGGGADDEFCRACHRVTHGNPFLLGELLREVAAEGIEPVAANATRLLVLDPRGVSRVVLLRLARLPSHARRLAHAVAVLGDGVEARDAGKLAELDAAQLAHARSALVRAEILVGAEESLRFVHPIVGNTLYDDVEASQRQHAHGVAARIRHARGASTEEVGAHLLRAGPTGDAWAAERLREAARRALGLGDPELAARLLERALAEQPPHGRAAIIPELAHAEARAGRSSAADRLREAIATAEDSHQRVLAARELAGVLMFGGSPREAAAVLRDAREALLPDEHELDELLQVSLVGTGYLSLAARGELSSVFDARRDPGRPAGSLLEAVHLAGLALDAAMDDAPADRAVELAMRALQPQLPTTPATGGTAFLIAVVALVFCERLSLAHELYTTALDDARARGNINGVAAVSALRAMAAYRRGAVLDAEADANAALEIEESTGLHDVALAYALLAALERGATPVELDALADGSAALENMDAPPYSQLLYARGVVALQGGDPVRAAQIFRSFDRPDVGWGAANPSVAPWRSAAALALAVIGDATAAERLAADEVERARGIGTPRSLGMALRAWGMIAGGERGVALLSEAVDALRHSEGRLERARALVELGAAIRRRGRRGEARHELSEGYALAAQCGSQQLTARAQTELAAAGARPRRSALVGVAALTPSERRVAMMAAAGTMNREIAQTLFVTEKTVETHLSHAYAKLNVRSRRELDAALGAAGER
jgi:DNA-binding CsgD family transcriptional regulator